MNGWNSLNKYERDIITNINNSGCHINLVFDPEGEDPEFAYSVGFVQSVGQPEVIVFGLGDLMGSMINDCLRACRGGLQLTDGVEVLGLLRDHRCVAREVHPSWFIIDYFNSAMWFHETQLKKPLEQAVQLVWPDATNGLLPWEEGCGELTIAYQPALYEPRVEC
jgi:hypothetical protein